MEIKSHYPSYDVMKEKKEWDGHTRAIVTGRLQLRGELRFLTAVEAELIREIASLLVDDTDPEILEYVIRHVDQSLNQSPGEGQRQAGVPEAPVLVRMGLKAIEQESELTEGVSFMKLERKKQERMLKALSENRAGSAKLWREVPQSAFFQKLLSWTVEAYCSHPLVWSGIGYGGPAYPRGYIRTQLGQLEPWEAHRET
ncbi:gluconate 2-dehydrogenase subunit 3 family protein [Gorillibacterium sp. sgz5001074]|uniref:gluconate 2-dehydrogenase subunit 3 family protein n=1 Tax=Gorillibacterium sp. sgz5001074 TaxID=3446695 RepID=UPI003F663EB6